MPDVPLDWLAALLLAVQHVLIGVALGFAVRIVFAAVEMAGEVIVLQMGLNFARFFDPPRRRRPTPPAACSARWWRRCSS